MIFVHNRIGNTTRLLAPEMESWDEKQADRGRGRARRSTSDRVLGAGAASASSKPPFYPIDKKTIKVPNDVQPWLPTYSPDGKHIVFQNQLDGSTWATSKDGRAPAASPASSRTGPTSAAASLMSSRTTSVSS